MPRILVIEPEPLTRQLLRDVLSPYFEVDAASGPVAPGACDDLIIIEPNAPGTARDFSFIRHLRAAAIATPVLILSAVADPPLVAEGLRAGADEYMRKPFHVDELLARVRAVLRRTDATKPAILEVGGIAIDLGRKTVKVDGHPVHFTAKEFGILEALARRAGLVITHTMLMDHLYGGLDEPEIKIIEIFVCKIRRKLGAAARHLVTHWGRGYALTEDGTAPYARPLDRSLSVVHQVRPAHGAAAS